MLDEQSSIGVGDGSKQIVTRTKIAKMAGTDVTHFLKQRARFVAISFGVQAGLKNVGVDLINLPVGAMASAFHRHLCADECIYIPKGSGVARIGPDLFQIEAGGFIFYLAGVEAHDIRNTCSTHMTSLVEGQRLEFDIIDYPELNKRLHRHAGQPPDLVDIAAVGHPRLSDHHG